MGRPGTVSRDTDGSIPTLQWFFYSAAVWRGPRFHTVMHGVFSVAWVYVTMVFAVALWVNSRS